MSRTARAMQREFDDHPSICDSLEDFEPPDDMPHSPASIDSPSQHSSFRSESTEPESSEMQSDDESVASPAAWRLSAHRPGTGWFQHDRRHPILPSIESSRAGSPSREDEDITIPANVPLPQSPEKRRSPDPSPRQSPAPELSPSPGESARASAEPRALEDEAEASELVEKDHAPNNYLLWSMHFKLRHRTEPFEAAWMFMWDLFERVTRSPTSLLFTCLVAFVSVLILRVLTKPLEPAPTPDLVKVAGMAKSFETLIHYSENGVEQIGDLQETGVAVWDLCETVRSTNMTSAPIITQSLDELSESLKTLAVELTRFFASVDGDVDSILIVMEWAKRELTHVSSIPQDSLTSAFDNLQHLLSRVGLLETSRGEPTAIGRVLADLFGPTHIQRKRAALQRTFTEFLSVLEESINSELTYSTALFGLFEAIDRQFLNLQRSVVRETDQQEREEGILLASLWTRLLGSNASRLAKFERNRGLLASIRDRTVRNKHILVDHNGKLLKLKSSLEILRKKLVSPLLRSNDSSTMTIEEQISGLSDTYEHLHAVRERQKGKLLEQLYKAGRRLRVAPEDHVPEIEAKSGV